MQQHSNPRLKAAQEQIGAWLLDQLLPQPLGGQCWDPPGAGQRLAVAGRRVAALSLVLSLWATELA